MAVRLRDGRQASQNEVHDEGTVTNLLYYHIRDVVGGWSVGYNNGRDNHEGKIGVSVGKSGRISKLLRRSWSRSLEVCAQLHLTWILICPVVCDARFNL